MKDSRLIKSLEVKEGRATHVDIQLYYSIGGMNYFTGNNETRGLYVSASPYTKNSFSKSFTAFSGVKQLVKEMKRFNKKTLDEFILDEKLVDDLLNNVLEKNNIVLKENQLV